MWPRRSRRGQVHGRLEALEARQAARCVIPLAVRRAGGILESSDSRLFPSLAALMAETGQAKPPMVIGPEMPGGDQI